MAGVRQVHQLDFCFCALSECSLVMRGTCGTMSRTSNVTKTSERQTQNEQKPNALPLLAIPDVRLWNDRRVADLLLRVSFFRGPKTGLWDKTWAIKIKHQTSSGSPALV